MADNSHLIDYAKQLLQEDLPFHRSVKGGRVFDLLEDILRLPVEPKAVAKHWRKERRYVYLSPKRPLTVLKASDFKVDEIGYFTPEGKGYSWLFTNEPLALEEIYRFELAPHFTHGTRGLMAIQMAAMAGTALELAMRPEMDRPARVAVLFRNPRRIWQMSYFEEGVGPVGHDEATLERSEDDITKSAPEDLAEGALRQGYRIFSPGLLDNLTETFPEPAALRKQYPGYSGLGAVTELQKPPEDVRRVMIARLRQGEGYMLFRPSGGGVGPVYAQGDTVEELQRWAKRHKLIAYVE